MSQNQPVEVQLTTKSKNLYLFFGGIAAGIAMPPFEFYRSANILDENKIFIRDFAQCWYQDGLPGISSDVYSTSHYLQRQIERIKPEKIVFVGNSMGGFAAILFATLIGKGEVIAFAPQTFISPVLRLLHGDIRWSRRILITYKRSFRKARVWDTKPLLKRNHGNHSISIYVSKDNRLDHIHALHLKTIPNVKIFAFNGGGHGIVRFLRDVGKLAAIMSNNHT